jgi:prepilin-type processing-associated H-X9-DG protein
LVTVLYPEYLTDANIAVCPSDPQSDWEDRMYVDAGGHTGHDADSQFCFGDYDTNGGSCMRNVDQSYQYYGWLFDMLDDTDPVLSLSQLATLINPILDDDEQINPAAEGPAQFVDWATKLIIGILPYYSSEDPALNNLVDQDWEVTTGLGNGGTGNTIYRLREGIERFLITDINNPAGSARAQSEVYVMWDAISTLADNFNHVPGGSNVLYMDGHSEFVKYPGRQPITHNAAVVAGALAGAG